MDRLSPAQAGTSQQRSRPQSSSSYEPFPTLSAQNTHTSHNEPSRPQIRRTPNSSVRIRRMPSSQNLTRTTSQNSNRAQQNADEDGGRRRSTSAPQRPQVDSLPMVELNRQSTAEPGLPTVQEESSHPQASESDPTKLAPPGPRGRLRSASDAARSWVSNRRSSSSSRKPEPPSQEYSQDVVDVLDVIDPEVSTLTTLNNVQNSLFIPYLGRFYDRRPTYNLSTHQSRTPRPPPPPPKDEEAKPGPPAPLTGEEIREDAEEIMEYEDAAETGDQIRGTSTTSSTKLARSHTLTSTLSGTGQGHNFAVLPHGTILDGWSDQDKDELNDHVRHMLHSRRSKFSRSMKAFGKFVQKPMGFLITLYAFLLTFWGAAWVLFLIGWIYVGGDGRQQYFIEICDQILTALFTVVGLGLAPFRAIDTYHTIYVVHYHFLTWRIRRQKGLPELIDPNELPDSKPGQVDDLELGKGKSLENTVLTPEQQEKLLHHQNKLALSHTFYKPHETFTHSAFSIKILLTIIILLDLHSCFQAALGGTTWGIYYQNRPRALTAVILSCSITCNISGGIWITIGDRRSRKKEVVEQLVRQDLTQEAMEKMRKDRGLETKNKMGPYGHELKVAEMKRRHEGEIRMAEGHEELRRHKVKEAILHPRQSTEQRRSMEKSRKSEERSGSASGSTGGKKSAELKRLEKAYRPVEVPQSVRE